QESVFISGKVASLTYGNLATYELLDSPQLLAPELRQGLAPNQQTSMSVAEHREPALADVTVIHHRFPLPYRGMGQMSLLGP
ncbi:heat-inducible transcriptional repressor HrcA, partial [Streptococcus suis]